MRLRSFALLALATLTTLAALIPVDVAHNVVLYDEGISDVPLDLDVAPLHGERTYGATWTPWDGRYDSTWALVADVWEFGGTHGTDRSHIAVRIGRKHRAAYEKMIGGPLFDFDAKQLDSDGDGVSNLMEIEQGTLPADPNSKPGAASCQGGDNPQYSVCQYDLRLAYRRVLLDFCGASPNYPQVKAFILAHNEPVKPAPKAAPARPAIAKAAAKKATPAKKAPARRTARA